jgi:hypothetical protein
MRRRPIWDALLSRYGCGVSAYRHRFNAPRRLNQRAYESVNFRKPQTSTFDPLSTGERKMHEKVTTTANTNTTPSPVRFSLGRLFMTPGASEALEEAGQSAQEFLSRHARLEQGELSTEDHKENLFSVDKPLRIFSTYKTAQGVKLWVITEADRSATTILLPSEY